MKIPNVTMLPGYLVEKASKSKFIKKQAILGVISASTAAQIALWSGVSKDAVGCYYYVTQSLKNEKIPEEKRKFVASLDLANGILNVLVQTLLGSAFAKGVEKYFNNNIKESLFSKETAEKKIKKILKYNETHKNKPKILPDLGVNPAESAENLAKYIDKDIKKLAKKEGKAAAGFAAIATLIITQVIAKRVIVPLIATPMASKIKAKMEKNEAGKSKTSPNASQQTDSTKVAANVSKSDKAKTPKCFKNFR